MIDVVAKLRQRCGNVAATSWQRRTMTLSQLQKLTLPQLSFSTLPQHCDNVNHDVATTLSQHRCASWDNNSGNQQFWYKSFCSNNTINTDFGYLNLTELQFLTTCFNFELGVAS